MYKEHNIVTVYCRGGARVFAWGGGGQKASPLLRQRWKRSLSGGRDSDIFFQTSKFLRFGVAKKKKIMGGGGVISTPATPLVPRLVYCSYQGWIWKHLVAKKIIYTFHTLQY